MVTLDSPSVNVPRRLSDNELIVPVRDAVASIGIDTVVVTESDFVIIRSAEYQHLEDGANVCYIMGGMVSYDSRVLGDKTLDMLIPALNERGVRTISPYLHQPQAGAAPPLFLTPEEEKRYDRRDNKSRKTLYQ